MRKQRTVTIAPAASDEVTDAPVNRTYDLRRRASRRLTSLLSPAIKQAADDLLAGKFQALDFQAALRATTAQLPDAPPAAKNAKDVDRAIPVPARPSPNALDPAKVAQILELRRGGASKPAISRAVKVHKNTISHVLAKQGDPASNEVRAREAATRSNFEAAMMVQVARKLGVSVEDLQKVKARGARHG